MCGGEGDQQLLQLCKRLILFLANIFLCSSGLFSCNTLCAASLAVAHWFSTWFDGFCAVATGGSGSEGQLHVCPHTLKATCDVPALTFAMGMLHRAQRSHPILPWPGSAPRSHLPALPNFQLPLPRHSFLCRKNNSPPRL